METTHKYRKLGGWMLFLVVMDVISLISTISSIGELGQVNSQLLRVLGNRAMTFVIISWVGSLLPLLAIPLQWFLLYKHDKRYTKVFIIFRVIYTVALVAIVFIGSSLIGGSGASEFVSSYTSTMLGSIAGVVLWFLYFRSSERVKVYFMSEEEYAYYMAAYAQQFYHQYGQPQQPPQPDVQQQSMLDDSAAQGTAYAPPPQYGDTPQPPPPQYAPPPPPQDGDAGQGN
ncbi:DUF2569 domain-containing protein [Eubacteriales bacterium OttesenSCG-928-N14]|nr:DUF2569 domain-containing protein [Eubacteriales bacterium OttesenSCG-928-N14]